MIFAAAIFTFTAFLFMTALIQVFLVYKIKQPWWQWAKVFVPPFIFLPFAFIPIDISQIFWWVTGIALALFSLIMVAVRLIALLRNKDLEEHVYLWSSLLRPSLAVLIFISALSSISLSVFFADNYAKVLSRKIQKNCQNNKACPVLVEEWLKDGGHLGKGSMRTYGPGYKMHYGVFPDRQKFIIIVYHGYDASFTVTGGVKEKLTTALWYKDRVIETKNLPLK